MSDPFQDTPPAFEGEEDPAADFLASQQNQLADLEDGDDFGFSSNTDTGIQHQSDLLLFSTNQFVFTN